MVNGRYDFDSLAIGPEMSVTTASATTTPIMRISITTVRAISAI